MSRYADVDVLMQSIRHKLGIASLDNLLESEKAIVQEIDSAPSIDIVRCGECKYAEVSVSPITGLWCTRFGINDMAMEDNDFCSYGERKESE